MGRRLFRVPLGWREPIDIVIPCRSKIKRWAFENAYTLIFMSFMFVTTWIVFALAMYFYVWRHR